MITSYKYGRFELPRSDVLQDQSWMIITYECCAHILVKIESTLYHLNKYSFENVTKWVTENCSLVNKSFFNMFGKL